MNTDTVSTVVEETPIWALHSIGYHRRQAYKTSTKVDQLTGEYRIEAVVEYLTPGQIHMISADVAATLIKQGAARTPTQQELDLRELALRGPRK